MTFLIELRTKIRHFMAKREGWVYGAFRFAFAFVALLGVNQVIGYQHLLNHWWVALLLAGLCAFVQMRAVTVIVVFYAVLHLLTLAPDVALSVVIVLIIGYIVCGYFQAKDTYHMVGTPLCHWLNIPFAVPIGAGLFGGIGELSSVLFGAVISYYMEVISVNATSFLEADSEMTASMLIQSKLLTNPTFYVYTAAMCGVFLLVYYLRTSEIRYAWTIAVTAGTVAEFLIMLANCLFLEGREGIPMLALGSAITFVLGMTMSFFGRGVDYNRTEKVLFEDDDYFYYVTAVPKVHITEQEKEVKKITEERE